MDREAAVGSCPVVNASSSASGLPTYYVDVGPRAGAFHKPCARFPSLQALPDAPSRTAHRAVRILEISSVLPAQPGRPSSLRWQGRTYYRPYTLTLALP